MKSANKIISFPKAKFRGSRNETAFLPAALEIVETPASPVGRAVAVTIIAIFCFALAWASLGSIDIVASAPGKIVPSDGTKVVQPFEIGIVRAIHIRDGQTVKAGDVLIELDPRINESERDHLQADLTAAQLEIARLKAALVDDGDVVAAFHPPDNAPRAQVDMQRAYLIKQTAEYQAKIDALDRQRDQKQAELETTAASIAKLSSVMPIVQERVDIRKASSDREYTSKFQYLEIQQLLVEQQQELLVQRSHAREVIASIAALGEARAQAIAEYPRTLFGQLAEAERKADGFVHDVAKTQQKINAQYLTAPIAGTVQQLAIHTAGGVVTPAQVLLALVPSDSPLEIEAMISNRDIGFVQPKQRAEIKVDTFNFTKYGLLHGDVLSVSQDAIVRDKPVDRAGEKSPGADNTSSEPKGQDLSFAARVSLDRSQMQIDDKMINLTPGMAVTVEIKTGSRSVLSYLLSPLIRYGHEGLRER
jgi:membrane fusion protein, hemolysin D